LIYGKWGAPAWAPLAQAVHRNARIYMAALLIGYCFGTTANTHRTAEDAYRIDQSSNLIALGIPAAIQFTLETGVRDGNHADRQLVQCHWPAQIALNTVAFTYMVPLGFHPRRRGGGSVASKIRAGGRVAGGTAILSEPRS
jgi:hypothetical protein